MNTSNQNKKSKKKNIVNEGMFKAELDGFFTRELAEDGYAGLEIRCNPIRTEIIIRATRPKGVLGQNRRRIMELTSLVKKRFFLNDSGTDIELYAERIDFRGLCAMAQAESLRYKLQGGLQVRKCCYSILRTIMEAGAKGAEVIVSGKLRAQRAKTMSFREGYMIATGHPTKEYIKTATRSVKMLQGIMGIQVRIMVSQDPTGLHGPIKPLPDAIVVYEPKPEEQPRVVPQASVVPVEEEILPVEQEADVEVVS